MWPRLISRGMLRSGGRDVLRMVASMWPRLISRGMLRRASIAIHCATLQCGRG